MPKEKNSIIVVGVIIVVLFIGGRLFGVENKFVNNTISFVTRPVGTIFSNMGWWFHTKVDFFSSIGDLKVDNQMLFDEKLALQAKLVRLAEIEKENNLLREELALAPREDYKLEAVLVIGRESGNYSEIIHINKGIDDGIKKGMAILVGEGILIGRIENSAAKTSTVRLITDKDFRVNTKLLESDGKGVIFGQYGTSAIMKMIPKTININKGDAVITSELSDSFRKGLLVGYVQEIFSTEDGLFQEATILLPRELENLHLVWVLLE